MNGKQEGQHHVKSRINDLTKIKRNERVSDVRLGPLGPTGLPGGGK